VPERTPALNVTPVGNVVAHPERDIVGVGTPVAVGVKLPAVPTVKVVELALVMTGIWSTVRVNF
jgi:hypothetical protein